MGKYASRAKAYGDAQGPFGFPMPSGVAREVERILKTLPSDCRDLGLKRVSSQAVTLEVSPGERTDVSLVTSDAIDRDREVILPEGGDWSQFLKNPVVTFAHRYDELPVGRALWVKRQRDGSANGWLAKTRYTPRPEGWRGQWFPDAVWHFVRSGDMPGKSIGFLPLEISAPGKDEIEARPEFSTVRMVIRRWLALEYAVAPVQSNPEALVVSAKATAATNAVTDAATDAANAAAGDEIERAVGNLDVHLMVADEIERLRGRV